MSTARLNFLISHLKQYIKEHPNKDIQISFGGTVEMVAEIGSMIVGGQLWSLALSVIIIIACYMIFFRSFTAGILAAIPLFCAITLVFGLMGIFKYKAGLYHGNNNRDQHWRGYGLYGVLSLEIEGTIPGPWKH